MKQILASGGPVLYLIIVTSVIAVGFIIERFLAFWRASTAMDEFFPELENHLRLGQPDEARKLCVDEPGIIPEVLLVGLENRDEGVESVKQILIDEIQVRALPRLEKHLSVLNVIGRVAPMLGLLGTVLGMITMFEHISHNPQFDVSDISRGIFQALGTTAAGLMVGIPIIFFHAHFTSRIRGFEIDFYKYLTRFLRILRRREEVTQGG